MKVGENYFYLIGFPVISLCGDWEKIAQAILKVKDITVSESQMPYLRHFEYEYMYVCVRCTGTSLPVIKHWV